MKTTQGDQEVLSLPEIANHLNLTFNDYRLLGRALTHRSYINEHPEALEDNERLEFLGDAVLDFLVGAWLYNRFPELKEGGLTRLRAGLVGNKQLAKFARQIDLGAVLRLGYGESVGGGRNRGALLGSAFEALIGALFLDQGFDAVRRYVEPMLDSSTEVLALGGEESDPKSRLQEWVQARGMNSPIYQTMKVSGPDHKRDFEIAVFINGTEYGRGHGPNKRAAAKTAAQSALERFEDA